MKNIIIDKLKDFPSIEIEVVSSNKDKYAAFLRANIAIVTSGTAALELSYFNVAYITSYKFNPLTYFILQFLIKSKVGNLINIINQKKIIPELLQNECNAKEIYKSTVYFLKNPKFAQNQVEECSKTLDKIRPVSSSSEEAARVLNKYLIS